MKVFSRYVNKLMTTLKVVIPTRLSTNGANAIFLDMIVQFSGPLIAMLKGLLKNFEFEKPQGPFA